jgi:hypothetical protein
MLRKILWFSWPLVASSLVFLAFRAGAVPGAKAGDPRVEELAGEMAELRRGLSNISRSVDRMGGAAGANALLLASQAVGKVAGSNSAASGEEGPEDNAQLLARVAAHREDEKRYFTRLDEQIRKSASPGGVATVQMRKNVEVLRALGGNPGDEATIEDVDCSDTMCRVSVRLQGRRDLGRMRDVSHALTAGMAQLTTAPGDGERTVFYVAAAGAVLPPITP